MVLRNEGIFINETLTKQLMHFLWTMKNVAKEREYINLSGLRVENCLHDIGRLQW